MIGHRFLVPSLLFAVATTACSRQDPDPPGLHLPAFHDVSEAPPAIQRAARAVVRIATGDSYATGSFINDSGVLLTNNHVLGVGVCPREGCFARITRMHQRHEAPQDAQTVFVVPIAIDIGLDMAVLQAYAGDGGQKGAQLSTPDFVAFDPRDAASLEGTHVHVVGHPEGRLKKWTSGDVVDSSGAWIKSTAFILPGNSGSPILDDDGRIVGLLHRGPTSQDLLTSDGADTYSIGTASAALVAVMNAPLPAALRSTAATVTDADVVAHEALYRHARASSATQTDGPRPVIAALGDACDAGLARQDYASPEDLASALAPCFAGERWLECRADESADDFGVCPSSDVVAAWRARFESVYEHYRALNGSVELDAVTFGLAELETSQAAGESAAAAKLQQVLDDARPPLDFGIAEYLAAFGVDGLGGTRTVDFLRGYSKVPHYELAAIDIVATALWLNQGGALDGNEVRSILSGLAADDKVSIGSKLYIEEVQYNSHALD